MSEKIEKYNSLSTVLALAYGPMAEENNVSHYSKLTSKLMDADEDISYVIICDDKEQVLFVDARGLNADKKNSFVGDKVSGLSDITKRLSTTLGGEFKKLTIPTIIGSDKKGRITVGFGANSVDKMIDHMQSKLMATFAAAFLVGILGAISLTKTIVKPIKHLISAAHAVTAGDLDACVPVGAKDEIGELSGTFNQMVKAMKESRDKLIQRANTDSLTELYNHRYFQERLNSELRRAARYNRPLSVIMLDIDHFKSLNDNHGHPFGDKVLQDVAGVLLSHVRDIDIVARYGGEEFAVILPETGVEDSMAMAERLRLAVQRHCFATESDDIVPVTISLGIAQYPVHSSEREGLIMAADMAMYQSKSMGRNKVTAFSTDIRADKSTDPYQLYLLLHATDMSTLEAMAAAVDAKGHRCVGFSRSVMQRCIALAEEMCLSEKEQHDIKTASLLHDIGKLGISEEILNKKETLTDEEQQIIRSHPTMGYAVVQKSPHLKSMLPGILYHHECWDGTGYPNGLKGEEIPLIARIISLADAYHAMLEERPHSRARSIAHAKEEILRCSGTQFDPSVVEAFLKVLSREQGLDTREAA